MPNRVCAQNMALETGFRFVQQLTVVVRDEQ
jgi:hypothetical protein